jgi:hypothetical protein
MATDLSSLGSTDVELLYQYLGQRLESGAQVASLEETLAEFAEYRRELEQMRASLREAEASSARGESKPLDLDEFFARADNRLEAEGIPE